MQFQQITESLSQMWKEVANSDMNANLKEEIHIELGRAIDAIRRADDLKRGFDRARQKGCEHFSIRNWMDQ